MSRTVIHLDVPDFHIAVERVLEPRLHDRPVAVAVQTATRALVYSTSSEARQNGVYRGMALDAARKNCPDLTVLAPRNDLYSRATEAVIAILRQFSPVIEPLRFGHAYLDMTGSQRLFGSFKDAAFKAQKEIHHRLRLDANAGVASNKLVSKVASDVVYYKGEQSGLCDVQHGHESNFLAPLEVGFLPGVKRPVRQQLYELNIRLIREVTRVSSEHLQLVFGRFGLLLYERACGVDNRPVQPPKKAPEIVQVETLQQDSNDFDELMHLMFRALYAASRRLREKEWTTRRLVIELTYSDHKNSLAQQRFVCTQDEYLLTTRAQQVLQKCLTRRVRVRKLTLKLCDLTPVPQQLSLFDTPENQDPRLAALTLAMDRIRNRYGEQAIQFGRAA